MSHTITELATLTTTNCCTCGVLFAAPERLLADRREKGGNFYCPNGHSLRYTKPENVRLKEQLDASRVRARHLEDQREATERSNRALRGQITRHKKRAANGVCPCCNRTFANVARHIAGQHPQFRADSSEATR
ncbi:hypothetical protein [Amycolatopsis palatopharyngis]|uniref:hypothetical protein n=1 Tax=Amycolatopsis palatopharyngis TaxID=187982 RepID=UPI000E268B05|nr:hypothetical protein [Amycolatopsis palatopharyngis]